ncbi:1-acyl-sn-glycerol-3-phosphate acyltransferase PLS1-like isoform X4 [Magnolia sinica]|uniref:1-acyl-sn-glycerol-3-phosphate acyltransferase PLS1-like isoform X4 n=1 Tax=Magnolia sinica TaxID=86752 RepID=UPI0026580447|nr:1-acyl-sn-glycerol-3-phosphate acyltransferase PLS1-like isoform X4 [Magnolia sinica]
MDPAGNQFQIQLYADSETFQSLGKEHALVICNHRSDIDWLVGWVLAQRSGCLGSTLAIMKKSSKFLPLLGSALSLIWRIKYGQYMQVIGWSMWFSDYVFLERSWAKDESTLKSGLQQLKNFPRSLWLALFVEGTRFTEAKLLAAQEYAASAKLPIPRNVLVPRTKGFVSAVSNMRSFAPAIYDVTVAVPKSQPAPTMLRILNGQSSVIHVHMKRHPMKELPQTDDAVAQWCRDLFVAKDALLDKHLAEDTFGDREFRPTGRPKKPLLVVISWSCLLMFSAFKFFTWSALLSTWKGLAFSISGLLLVMIVMHVLILFSQSERSTSAKAAPSRSKSRGAPSDANPAKQN